MVFEPRLVGTCLLGVYGDMRQLVGKVFNCGCLFLQMAGLEVSLGMSVSAVGVSMIHGITPNAFDATLYRLLSSVAARLHALPLLREQDMQNGVSDDKHRFRRWARTVPS